ncbi:O-antigen polymerase [Celeribacter sp.]|uniref:O-antigen polymerase n=1 Tax=Celeribacter sp. TaxID=1890673 RepID=UPI003A8D2F76
MRLELPFIPAASAPQKRDIQSLRMAYLLGWIIHLAGMTLYFAMGLGNDLLLAGFAVVSVALVLTARKTLADPLTVFLVSQLLYIVLPSLSYASGDVMRFGATYGPALLPVHVSFNTSLVVGIFLGVRNKNGDARKLRALRRAAGAAPHWHAIAYTACGISVFLTGANILLNGAVGLGSYSYAASFTVRLARGSGIFALGIPFAIAALTLFLVITPRLSRKQMIAAYLPILLLYISTGQRKYFILPFLIWAAARLTLTGRRLIGLTALASALYISFVYMGYLRLNGISFSLGALGTDFPMFWRHIHLYIEGETGILMAASSMAVDGRIPTIGVDEYLRAPLMALPQFLFGSLFEPLNERFAGTFTPDFAAAGGGWGFPFAGEAYVVGGIAGSVIVYAAASAYFAKLAWVWETGISPLWRAFSLANVYFALWVVRNAFAYSFREIFYVLAALLVSYAIGAVWSRVSRAVLTAPPLPEPSS